MFSRSCHLKAGREEKFKQEDVEREEKKKISKKRQRMCFKKLCFGNTKKSFSKKK